MKKKWLLLFLLLLQLWLCSCSVFAEELSTDKVQEPDCPDGICNIAEHNNRGANE